MLPAICGIHCIIARQTYFPIFTAPPGITFTVPFPGKTEYKIRHE